jgi:hypothetical protein
MHRSSESVGSIATALAKAQTELTNPEKSMVGTIHHNNRGDNPQTFRYAPLSGGLEIVRKILGGQQIAIAQTTEVDRISGLINLTTVLMHTSGEWISSDWPVCALAEASAPRRMGAALTYARRYALFTLVGIAGEDDLDAPDLQDERRIPAQSQSQVSPGTNAPPCGTSNWAQAQPPEARPSKSTNIPIKGILTPEDCQALRLRLLTEIETFTTRDDLQARAIEILKEKNRLPTDDAKLVEAAFAAKLADPDKLSTKPADQPIEVTSDGPLDDVSAIQVALAINRKRRKSLALKTPLPAITQTVPPTPEPVSSAADEKVTGKIDKSALTFGEVRRRRDKAHLRFVASHPCLICGRSPADAHHLRFAQPRAMGRKSSDEFTVPLCRAHHRENHQNGVEIEWWQKAGIDPLATASELWSISRPRTH